MNEPEINDYIIIKRRSGVDPEVPKGGVWKIAFADFMTAMMCFFLVMWLINASNEDTRQAVASYFNPMKLSELNPKGLQDPKVVPEGGPEAVEGHKANETPVAGPDGEEDQRRISREALFADPYGILAQIAAGVAPEAGATAGSGLLVGEGTSGGEAFRDPFDPAFRQMGQHSAPPEAAPLPGNAAAVPAEPQPDSVSAGVSDAPADADAPELPRARPETPDPAAEAAQADADPQQAGGEASADASPSDEQADLEAALSEAVGTGSATNAPEIAVQSTGEGLLISLTDKTDFGMFAVGSAEPQPDMVRIMERIAAILTARPGSIIIRGHTDARPFRTQAYDNWRLSTDRAQMAYYMLVRGGLDEARVEAIEGYAARRLKLPDEPEAAANRRIEIFLREIPS